MIERRQQVGTEMISFAVSERGLVENDDPKSGLCAV